MKKYAVIVAGGEGLRAGGDLPKQFQQLLGIPMLWWSVRAFHAEDSATHIILVLHPGFFDLWDTLYAELPEADRRIEVTLVAGGRSRSHSVFNGLMDIPDSEEALIAVHDAARPLVSPELISRAWQCAAQHLAAIPAVAVTDSLRQLDAPDSVRSHAVDRALFRAVQTPQTFRADVLKRSFRLANSDDAVEAGKALFSDEASLVEAAGYEVSLFEGSPINLKVTNPRDLLIARTLMENS